MIPPFLDIFPDNRRDRQVSLTVSMWSRMRAHPMGHFPTGKCKYRTTRQTPLTGTKKQQQFCTVAQAVLRQVLRLLFINTD